MAIQHRSCWRRSRQQSHVLTVEFIDRAPTVRLYDHTKHMSAAACCETSLHAHTDGRRHDHREGCEGVMPRGCWEGDNSVRCTTCAGAAASSCLMSAGQLFTHSHRGAVRSRTPRASAGAAGDLELRGCWACGARRAAVGALLLFNPFPDPVISEMTSAFHADARLRARRRP